MSTRAFKIAKLYSIDWNLSKSSFKNLLERKLIFFGSKRATSGWNLIGVWPKGVTSLVLFFYLLSISIQLPTSWIWYLKIMWSEVILIENTFWIKLEEKITQNWSRNISLACSEHYYALTLTQDIFSLIKSNHHKPFSDLTVSRQDDVFIYVPQK